MSITSDEARLRARNLRTLAALAALFLLPLLASFWLYYWTGWRPAGHVNHGQLIEPPRSLPAITLPRVEPPGAPAGERELRGATPTLFRRTWTLIYIGDGQCQAECRRALEVMSATHLGLGEDMLRVTPVYLVAGHCCAADLARDRPALAIFDATGGPGEKVLGEFPARGRAHSLFVVDPLGNLMMRYDVRQDPRGLLLDLKKLLRLSEIG